MASNKAENTKRLARNTLYLYFRSIFCLLLSLYSSRLILKGLGVDDYGINNAVAGFASMFTLVTGSLSSAISRFLTFEKGTGNLERQQNVFAISLNLMIGFALVILLLAETVGIWFVQNKMTIPEGREIASVWAFRCAILTTMTGLIVSPFNSAIIANEKIGIYALINIVEAVLRLGLALFLVFGSYTLDRLILFTVIWSFCTVGLQAFAILYSLRRFKECRPRLYFERNLFKELFNYAGWSFVASFSGTMAGQGVNMLINIFRGPAINAAMGLSGTVKRSIQMFVNNFTLALTPQITKAYASQDIEYTKYLTYRGTRFSFFIMFLFSLPVLLEADFVFTLWLGDVPEHTVNFNRLSLLICLYELMYSGFGTVQNATGKIRSYRLWISVIVLLLFPLSWIVLKLGCKPEALYYVNFITSTLCFIATYRIVQKTLNYDIKELSRELFVPELKVIVCSTALPLLSVLFLPYGWTRFLLTGTLCLLTTIPSILYIGCNKSERAFIINAIKSRLGKSGNQ